VCASSATATDAAKVSENNVAQHNDRLVIAPCEESG
jgi:hypothetical protein